MTARPRPPLSSLLSPRSTITAMEAMTTSFSSRVPAQIDKIFFYSGPPPEKKKRHSPKYANVLPELDQIVAQAGWEAGTGFPESGEDLGHVIDQVEHPAHTVFSLPLMDGKLICLMGHTFLLLLTAAASPRFRPQEIVAVESYELDGKPETVWGDLHGIIGDEPLPSPELCGIWGGKEDVFPRS